MYGQLFNSEERATIDEDTKNIEIPSCISNNHVKTLIKAKRHKFKWLRVRKFPEFPPDLMREIIS